MEPAQVRVGIVGAGTMGGGIARLAHRAGHPVVLFDDNATVVAGVLQSLDGDAPSRAAASLADLATSSDIVIEAVFEDLSVKQRVFEVLDAEAPPRTILASNTSALPISRLATATHRRRQVLGVHFMNFARFGPLVEVIPTNWTDPAVAQTAGHMLQGWGLTVVAVSDTPGFLVNRVNRLFTLEPIRLVASGEASVADIDRTFLEAGFPMGPLQFVDFVGADLHLTVSASLYEAFYHAPRFRPSALQRHLVESGQLGRKTGAGFYRYEGDSEIDVAPQFEPRDRPSPVSGATVLDWTMLATTNEAFHVFGDGVASLEDIDLAMTVGLRYPYGPVAWARERGFAAVLRDLEELTRRYGERYLPAPALRREAD